MLQLGRQGKLYVVTESAFGVYTNPASADAIRHENFLASHDPTSKRNSTEKKFSPGRAVRFTGREVAGLNQLTALVRPSGTLNTLPEATEVLEAAFGSKTNVTLATTVAASPAPTTTVFTVASVGTLAVGDCVLITCTDTKKRVRRITAINTLALTVSPALPAAPATGAAVKGVISYKLTTALSISLAMLHYLTKTDGSTAGFKRALKGIGIDKLSLVFDGNGEPKFTASGPAGTMATGAGVPSQPAAFTTVGGNPPSGLTGELWVDTAAYTFLKAQFDLTNGLAVRNNSYGTATANELFRQGRRDIGIGIDCNLEDEAAIYDQAEAGTSVNVALQTGYTEGNIIAVLCPQVEFKVPDTDDPDTETSWGFKGMALESADNQNDEMYLVLA